MHPVCAHSALMCILHIHTVHTRRSDLTACQTVPQQKGTGRSSRSSGICQVMQYYSSGVFQRSTYACAFVLAGTLMFLGLLSLSTCNASQEVARARLIFHTTKTSRASQAGTSHIKPLQTRGQIQKGGCSPSDVNDEFYSAEASTCSTLSHDASAFNYPR